MIAISVSNGDRCDMIFKGEVETIVEMAMTKKFRMGTICCVQLDLGYLINKFFVSSKFETGG